ncbi:MAG: galactokinase [Gemmatimonadota bacterium]
MREVRALFRSNFGVEPTVIASAPGRVNLIGEHTDYNGGQVLPIAIGHRTWVAARGAGRRDVSRVVSSSFPGTGEFVASSPEPAGSWWDYVHGALRETMRMTAGEPAAADLAVVSTVPPGAGLSSSAALEVATVVAGLVCARARLIDHLPAVGAAAHRAETGFVGVPSGIMDQMASAYGTAGNALRIWCDSGRTDAIPCGLHVLIVDSATPRELRRSRYSERREECKRALEGIQRVDQSVEFLAHATAGMVDGAALDTAARKRALHVVGENERVARFVESLRAGSPNGDLLLESHMSLRELYECSTPELDWIVEQSMKLGRDGVVGARLTGAGWGGCAIVAGDETALGELRDPLERMFAERWGRPARTWLTQAESGMDVDWADGWEED